MELHHFEVVDWHGFAADDQPDVQMLQNGANSYSHTCNICTVEGEETARREANRLCLLDMLSVESKSAGFHLSRVESSR